MDMLHHYRYRHYWHLRPVLQHRIFSFSSVIHYGYRAYYTLYIALQRVSVINKRYPIFYPIYSTKSLCRKLRMTRSIVASLPATLAVPIEEYLEPM